MYFLYLFFFQEPRKGKGRGEKADVLRGRTIPLLLLPIPHQKNKPVAFDEGCAIPEENEVAEDERRRRRRRDKQRGKPWQNIGVLDPTVSLFELRSGYPARQLKRKIHK